MVDIVIPTGGRFDMLEKCINAIREYATIPVSITIVDDASDKEKKAKYKHLFDGALSNNVVQINVRRNEIQQGFSASCNAGAKMGTAPLICFMNDDITVTSTYFDNLIKAMEDKSIGICGAKLLFPENSTDEKRPGGKVQHIGLALDITAGAVHPLIGWSANNPKTCVTREVFATTGALLTIRRPIFNQLGGFDIIYGKGYWEDVDLCLRVRQKGYKIVVDCSLIAYHYTSASSEINSQFASNFQTNAMTFRSRWGNTGLLVTDNWTYG